MKTVLVLGATSPTAQAFIRLMETEFSDYQLRLFVRNESRLPRDERQQHTVIIGDGSSYDDYVKALNDVDYIYNSIGGLETGPIRNCSFRQFEIRKRQFNVLLIYRQAVFTANTCQATCHTYPQFVSDIPNIREIS